MDLMPVDKMQPEKQEVVSRRPPIHVDINTAFPLSSFLVPHHYQEYLDTVLIPRGLILNRIEKLAQDIRSDYDGKTIHLLCVLKGGSAFFHQLIEYLRLFHNFNKCDYVPFTFDFIRVKSYKGVESTGEVSVTGADLTKFSGKHLLIVEDIIDTGNTMTALLPIIKKYNPASVKVTSLLEKRTDLSCGFLGDYVGFSIPNKFVVGFCLDYNESYRDLSHICVINEKGIRRWAHNDD